MAYAIIILVPIIVYILYNTLFKYYITDDTRVHGLYNTDRFTLSLKCNP